MTNILNERYYQYWQWHEFLNSLYEVIFETCECNEALRETKVKDHAVSSETNEYTKYWCYN